jgi:23S rRNA (guanine2445-N2)-methyltransferase / 23S rRNA (guanine2069-N7)-methyltransferase
MLPAIDTMGVPMCLDLVATSTFGLEAVVARELAALGYEGHCPQTGRIEFSGDLEAVVRANLWLRSADRVLIRLGRFEARDFDALFHGVQALPWERWIPAEGRFPVSGRSVKSGLSSVPAVQRCVKKAIVTRLLDAHATRELPETGPAVAVEVALLKDVATLTIDTSGDGLHKRGYRDLTGAAPLRETLAAALVQLTFWNPDRPLLDPFCGSGTILIEAAMIGRSIAPGLQRRFAAESWPALAGDLWPQAREQARGAARPASGEHIFGSDIDKNELTMAQRHAIRAGVADSIRFEARPFADLASEHQHGCLVTNPPYGERLDAMQQLQDLYHSMPLVLRRLPTWSFFILTSWTDFEELVGRRADRRRKLYNGSIECTYYQFHGPRPGADGTTAPGAEPAEPFPTQLPTPSAQVFGGLSAQAKDQADVFANRLRKIDRHRRRWPARRGITCYRVYNRDIPDVPLMVDRYEDCLHIAEYQRPHDRSPAEHADWLDLMVLTARLTLDVAEEKSFVKQRRPQRGTMQYEKLSDDSFKRVVQEGGLRFEVNLSDYLDTGLFLDHRITREMVGKEAEGKRILNLFAYTGSFSVSAAAGGAARVTSVDLSSTYLDWARRNFKLNDLPLERHDFVRADALDFVNHQDPSAVYDLAVVDAPTFSNSKRTTGDWEIQEQHAELLTALARRMAPGGVIYFATNFRRFKLDDEALGQLHPREISGRTVPEDFANKRTHRCWRMTI